QIAAGLLKPDGGRVRGAGAGGYVSQNPAHHALRETVAAEVAYALENQRVGAGERTRRVRAELERFGLGELEKRHPRDLSSGELLARGGFFACQLGLALGCVSIADAVQLLAGDRERTHV